MSFADKGGLLMSFADKGGWGNYQNQDKQTPHTVLQNLSKNDPRPLKNALYKKKFQTKVVTNQKLQLLDLCNFFLYLSPFWSYSGFSFCYGMVSNKNFSIVSKDRRYSIT